MSLIALLRENTRKAKIEQFDEKEVVIVETFLLKQLTQHSEISVASFYECFLHSIPTSKHKLMFVKDFCDKHGLGYVYENPTPNVRNSSYVRISW